MLGNSARGIPFAKPYRFEKMHAQFNMFVEKANAALTDCETALCNGCTQVQHTTMHFETEEDAMKAAIQKIEELYAEFYGHAQKQFR